MGRKYEFVGDADQKIWQQKYTTERRIAASMPEGEVLFISIHSHGENGNYDAIERLAQKGFRLTIEEAD